MSKWDKLILKISLLSKDLRFSELRKVLESYGYVMNSPKGGSSHYTFRKKGCMPITIPKHEPIKRVYVEMVRLIIEKEEKNNAKDAKKAWIEAALEEGIEINEPDSIEDYSGQFKLRIPKTLHRTLALNAKREGISMNQYCVYLLSRNDALLSK